jgi:hypothetical protein
VVLQVLAVGKLLAALQAGVRFRQQLLAGLHLDADRRGQLFRLG